MSPELVETMADGWLDAVDRMDALGVTGLETRAVAGRMGATAMVEAFHQMGCPPGEIGACGHSAFTRVERMHELPALLNQKPAGRA